MNESDIVIMWHLVVGYKKFYERHLRCKSHIYSCKKIDLICTKQCVLVNMGNFIHLKPKYLIGQQNRKNFTLNYAWIHFFFMILYSLYILWHTILIYLVVYRTKDNLLQRVMILADELLKYFPIILSLLLSLEYGFNETRSLLSCLSTIISKYITYLIIVLCALHLKIFLQYLGLLS